MGKETESAGFREKKRAVLWKAKALGLTSEQIKEVEKIIYTTGNFRQAQNWVDILATRKTEPVSHKIRVAFSNLDKVELAEELAKMNKPDKTGTGAVVGMSVTPFIADYDEGRQAFFFDKPIKKLTLQAILDLVKVFPVFPSGAFYGNLATMTLRNGLGEITAKLYILPNGRLADDSWLCNKGWK